MCLPKLKTYSTTMVNIPQNKILTSIMTDDKGQ